LLPLSVQLVVQIRDPAAERQSSFVVAGLAGGFRRAAQPVHRLAAIALGAKHRRSFQGRDHVFVVSRRRARNIDHRLHHSTSRLSSNFPLAADDEASATLSVG